MSSELNNLMRLISEELKLESIADFLGRVLNKLLKK